MNAPSLTREENDMTSTINYTYEPMHGREVVAAPRRMSLGTTALVVTRSRVGAGGKFHIEAVRITQDGLANHREVFTAKTRAEVRAWFAGNKWNPGGPLSRPADWLET